MRFTYLLLIPIALLSVLIFIFAVADTTVPANTVRLIYFVPSDRTAQSDIDSKIDVLIKGVQTTFADRMETAGHGRKTFTFEKNSDGTVKVHHIIGEQTDAYYDTANKWEIWNEIRWGGFNPETHICIVFVDLSSGDIDGWCGTGGDWLVNFGDDNIWRDTGGGL